MMPMMKELNADTILVENYIGSNSGNLMFLTSIARALMTDDDVQIDSRFGSLFAPDDSLIDMINAEYDYFIMPLANAFRSNYRDKLRSLARLVSKLKIPCVVTSVGIQAPSGSNMKAGFPFDADARSFVGAVLDKSAMLGVRGEHTADYLKHLGISEERHFAVTGCPSMFMWGSDLPEIRKVGLNAGSRVCVNGKPDSSEVIHDFMAASCRQLKDFRYIPQTVNEFWMMGYGIPLFQKPSRSAKDYIPFSQKSSLIRDGRTIGFLNAYAWIDYLRSMDFSYGCNIHGNIASLLAGTPAMVVEGDMRVGELASYFDIPRINGSDISSGRSIFDIYMEADYGPMQRNHRERFERFTALLDRNGLEHIYSDSGSVKEAPYDRFVRKMGALPVFTKNDVAGTFDLKRKKPIYRKVYRFYKAKAISKIKRMLHI